MYSFVHRLLAISLLVSWCMRSDLALRVASCHATVHVPFLRLNYVAHTVPYVIVGNMLSMKSMQVSSASHPCSCVLLKWGQSVWCTHMAQVAVLKLAGLSC